MIKEKSEKFLNIVMTRTDNGGCFLYKGENLIFNLDPNDRPTIMVTMPCGEEYHLLKDEAEAIRNALTKMLIELRKL